MAAKEGANSNRQMEITIPKIEIKNQVNEFFYQIWRNEWIHFKGGRMAKEFYCGPDSNKAKYVYKLSRMELSRFLRIIAGHNGLFYFCNKIDQNISPLCRFCNEEHETFRHFIHDCPPLRKARQDIFLDAVITDDLNWSVRDLIDFSKIKCINEALEGEVRFPELDASFSSLASDPDIPPEPD